MLKIKYFTYLALLLFFSSVNPLLKLTANGGVSNEITTITGKIKGLSKGSLQLILEQDINRKKSTLIAKIPVELDGRFQLQKILAPHIYSLKINDQKTTMLAIEKGEHFSHHRQYLSSQSNPSKWFIRYQETWGIREFPATIIRSPCE